MASSHSAVLPRVPEWSLGDLVLLDAYDRAAQQDDRTRSAFAALDVLDSVSATGSASTATIVVYSTAMRSPQVHLALCGYSCVAACYEPVSLIDDLPALARGTYDRQVGQPERGEWAELHPRLPPGADLAGAHRLMRSRPDAWRLVWDAQAPFSRATQAWINRNVLPVLGLSSSRDAGIGYRLAVQIVRLMALLPVQP